MKNEGKKEKNEELLLSALRIKQSPKRILYSFAVDGKTLSKFTMVSKARRGEDSEMIGYQRPEVYSHIESIKKYLESSNPMIPNALVIAFDSRVKFEVKDRHHSGAKGADVGTLIIPLQNGDKEWTKPGWIVDGQQRFAAIRDARIDSFPVFVTGFIADDEHEQREQFILVNSTKPLPKGLIYELLPSTKATLPTALQKKRFPAYLMTRLNIDEGSPLKGLIITATNPGGIIKDNSILKMIENSLSDGALYRFRNFECEEDGVNGMLEMMCNFWSAVATVFRHDWGLPARRSRLMHGAGIVCMGYMMDAIAERYRSYTICPEDYFVRDLMQMQSVFRWSDGYWDFGPGAMRKWNEIQNTPKDIQLLVNYVLIQYKNLVWNPAQTM